MAAGLVTNDSWRALRELVRFRPGGDVSRPVSSLEAQLAARMPDLRSRRPGRLHEARRLAARRLEAAPLWSGRWSLVHRLSIWGQDPTPEERVDRQARQLLARYGVVSRDCLAREGRGWPWEAIYSHLQALEMRGEIRRGYFVEGLAGAQFALPDAVESLRAPRGESADGEMPVVLGAWDPALFAAPRVLAALSSLTGSPLVRRPSSYAVLLHGRPLLWLERFGRAIVAPGDVSDAERLLALRAAFAAISARTGRRRLTVETWNGTPALGSPAQPLLEAAGCYPHAPVLEWNAQA